MAAGGIQAASTDGRSRAGWLRRFYASAIGKKVAMAASGVVLAGFLVVHMAGNLLAFQGAVAINDYAAWLRKSLPLLWAVRALLLVSLLVHVHAAVALTRLARAARPARYADLKTRASTLSARTMRVGGLVLAAFVVFHLLHFTVGSVHPAFVAGDVYHNLVSGFRGPLVVGFYLLALAALALHLHHGIWSLFQTLGVNHPHVNGVRRGLARVLAVGLSVGFAAVPLAVVAGLLR